ncbi:MAG: hypothetical protein VB089_19180 [Anaerolineaceae bacterium]|nr:hypothetical protein [Anaerolineaceae bacterium]
MSKENGAKEVITSFDDVNLKPELFRWSPNGGQLAFKLVNLKDATDSLGVISISSQPASVKIFPNPVTDLIKYWWIDDEHVVIHGVPQPGSTAIQGESLIWLSTLNGQITDQLSAMDTPDHQIISAEYFTPSRVAFFSDYGFYVYDSTTGSIQCNFNNYFNYTDWSLAPIEFPGSINCPNR